MVITRTLLFLKRLLLKVRLDLLMLILVTLPNLCCTTAAAFPTGELGYGKFAFYLVEHLHVTGVVFSNVL